MHMADALLSPAVGGALWAVAGGSLAWSAHRVRQEQDERALPLMGVLGAFVFAAQMINFTIPATGSSGHLGGGLLLAALLGPHAALLVITAVLTVQALLFADGGLLALGCNIVNLGVLPCLLVYPWLLRPLLGPTPSPLRQHAAFVLAALVALQLGALGVVAESRLSGISALPFATFAWLMLPIHLAIGLVEGLVTTTVITFLRRAEPGLLLLQPEHDRVRPAASRRALAGLALAALLTGGVLSWFASQHPDGLEWAIARVTGGAEPAAPTAGPHAVLERVQQTTALLPDYSLGAAAEPTAAPSATAPPPEEPTTWPAVEAGTSLAGVVGGLVTLTLAALVALLLRRRTPRQAP